MYVLDVGTSGRARLSAFARALQKVATLGEAISIARDEASEALGFQHAWMFVSATDDAREWKLLDAGSAKREDFERVAPVLRMDGDPMMEEIVASDGPVVVVDARTDPRTNKAIVEQLGNRTIVNVAMRLADAPFGAFGVGTFGDEGCRTPTDDELDHLVGMVALLTVAAARIRLTEEKDRLRATLSDLEQANARLRILSNTSHELAGEMDFEALVDLVAQRLAEHVGDGCAVRLLDETGQAFDRRITSTHHRDPSLVRDLRMLAATQPPKPGEGLTGKVIETGEAVLLPVAPMNDLLAQAPPPYREALERLDTTSLLAVPLRARGRTIGVLSMGRGRGSPPYGRDDLRLAQDLADRAAIAIDNARTAAAMRQSEARKAAVKEAALDAIVVMDHEGRIVDVNAACCALFGFQRSELVGALLADRIIPPAMREPHARGLALYLAGGESRVLGKRLELRAVRADGEELPVEVAVVRIESEGEPTFTGYIRDITERKRAARAEMLAHEKEAVEAANAELRSFSYSVAHDLRAPLRAIGGFTSILAAEHANDMSAEGRRLLDRVVANAESMSRLIDALLSLSRVSQADIHPEPVDVSALAATIGDELKAADRDRDAEVVVERGLVANGDARLVRALLENLMGNAWKFTRGVRGRIEVARAPTHEGTFYVRDNGAGFDAANAARLFVPFQRLHSNKEFEGTGIGLATVHRIVRRHGGKVWAESRPNEGATFYVTLPTDA